MPSAPPPRDRRLHRLLWGGVLLIGIAARLTHLFSGLEYDEIWTLENFAPLPLSRILTDLALPNNHPLNTLGVWICATLFQSPWSIRLPALLAGLGALPLMALVAFLWSRKWLAAWVATLIFALCTPVILYAQQAREYLDFRAHGLNVACEQLRQNIHQIEESLQLLQLNQAQVSGEIKHEIELALTSANHFLRQQQDALKVQLAALFQDDSEPLSEIRTRCETLLQTAQNTISRDFTLRFAELESTLCRVLTDVIRPIEQQVKMELSESGFRPGFHFPVFHGVVPHFNTRQLFSEVISRQEATDEQSTRLGVVRETFSRWLNQPDWGRGNEKSPTETVDYSVLQRALSAEVDLYCQQMAKVLAEQVDESVTAGMNTFFAEFASCLTELQTRLRESLALRQQNESVVRLMQQQLQQTVMTHGWIYTDAQLLRDDIQTLFTAERY